MPLVLTVKDGQSLRIAKHTVIRFERAQRRDERQGSAGLVKLVIISDQYPIKVTRDNVPAPGSGTAPKIRHRGIVQDGFE